MSKASEIIENLFESVKDKPKLDRVVSISESTWNMCYKEIGDIEKEHNRVCKVFNDKIIEQFNQIEQLKSKLKVAVENFEKIKNLECKHQACSIAARGVAQLALKEIES